MLIEKLLCIFNIYRSLDFTVNLFESIEKDIGVDMEQAVEKAYETTLKPWHGWISSTAYRVPFYHISLLSL